MAWIDKWRLHDQTTWMWEHSNPQNKVHSSLEATLLMRKWWKIPFKSGRWRHCQLVSLPKVTPLSHISKIRLISKWSVLVWVCGLRHNPEATVPDPVLTLASPEESFSEYINERWARPPGQSLYSLGCIYTIWQDLTSFFSRIVEFFNALLNWTINKVQ